MKRWYAIFSLLFLCSFLIIHADEVKSFHRYLDDDNPSLLHKKSLEEGFCAGTLIKTPHGYKAIENLAIENFIIDVQGNATEVVAITKRYVDKYIKIFLHNEIICVGCDQLLYFAPESSWIKARDLLSDVEHTSCPIFLYALTTQSHTLCVTHYDVCAHNTDAAILGAASMCLGHISIINPVVAVCGTTMALGMVAYNAYQEYKSKHKDKDNAFFAELPHNVMFADRLYYESKKRELEKLRQELIIVKNNLEKIHGIYSFSYQYLHQHTYNPIKNVPLLSFAQEKDLSHEQKSQLRACRENELILFEKQIQDLQLLLALHFNQLISNYRQAEQAYDDNMSIINQEVIIWNSSSNITDAIACKAYKHELLQKYLMQDLTKALSELKVAINYYMNNKNICIQKSTTIFSFLEPLISEINKTEQKITEDSKYISKDRLISEQYFAQHRIPTTTLIGVVHANFENGKKQQNAIALKNIETQLSNTSSPGGPEKDNEDDEDEEEEQKIKISEKDKDHIFRNAEGHFVKDTPEIRKIIEDMVADTNNYNGLDNYGTKWFSKIMSDGKQVWAGVRDNSIRYAGVNKIPWPKDVTTGLLIRSACTPKM